MLLVTNKGHTLLHLYLDCTYRLLENSLHQKIADVGSLKFYADKEYIRTESHSVVSIESVIKDQAVDNLQPRLRV